LALPPGTLSRHLGYLPLTAHHPSVLAAIDSDPRLSEADKALLAELYKRFVAKRVPARSGAS
jgi:hypothetical protein